MTLIEYRQAHGLTQAEVASGINAAVSTVSQYENGRVPKVSVMTRIVLFTGGAVTPNDFHGVAAA